MFPVPGSKLVFAVPSPDCPQFGLKSEPPTSVYAPLKIEITSPASLVGGSVALSVGACANASPLDINKISRKVIFLDLRHSKQTL